MLIDVEYENVDAISGELVSHGRGAKREHSFDVADAQYAARQAIHRFAGKPPLTAEWVGSRKPDEELTACATLNWPSGGHRTALFDTRRYELWIRALASGENFVEFRGAESDGCGDAALDRRLMNVFRGHRRASYATPES